MKIFDLVDWFGCRYVCVERGLFSGKTRESDEEKNERQYLCYLITKVPWMWIALVFISVG